MSDDLVAIVRGMTDNEAKSWMRYSKNKKLLIDYWAERFPKLTPFNNGEILFIIKTGESPICRSGNHRKFKQFPIGYVTSCHNSPCKCFYDMRSTVTITANAKVTPEVKAARREKQAATMLDRYGVSNAFLMADHREKSQKSIQDRYGVDRIVDIPGVKEQKIETSRRNWGTDHPRQSIDVIEKTKATSLDRFGTACPLHNAEVAEKVKETMLARFGVDNYFKSGENQREINRNRKERCGYENAGQRFLTLETLTVLSDVDRFRDAVRGLSYEQAAVNLMTSPSTIANYANRYGVISEMKLGYGSVKQTELYDWLVSLGEEVVFNTRQVIKPLELDLYLPNRKLAIEYNGVYTHSEFIGGKHPYYHRTKLERCRALGITLIQICSTHYRYSPDAVRRLILSKLGKATCAESNECTVVLLPYRVTSNFLLESDIDNTLNVGSIRLGLVDRNNDLLQVMTFGKPGNTRSGEYEIIRIATKAGNTVVGGTSKLFAHFVMSYDPDSVIMYSDLRYYTGDSLGELGFVSISESEPEFWYTDFRRLFRRRNFQKEIFESKGLIISKLGRKSLLEHKYDRVWDCGYTKWRWEK